MTGRVWRRKTKNEKRKTQKNNLKSKLCHSRFRGNDKRGIIVLRFSFFVLHLLYLMNEQYGGAIIEEKPLRLSAHLRAWRMREGKTIENIALELNIRPQFIHAFENADYTVFPARVYAAGYLKLLVDHFKIPDGDVLAGLLNTEWEELRGTASASLRLLPASQREKWYVTPGRLFMLGGIAGFLFFIWILVSQIIGFTGSPSLRIDEPRGTQVVATPLIRIKGVTEKESQLTVNGREITMDGDGAFDQEIELPVGVNVLDFLVQSRFGKHFATTRYVVVK